MQFAENRMNGVEAHVAAFFRARGATVTPSSPSAVDSGVDMLVELAGNVVPIAVKWAGHGFPRDVQRAMHTAGRGRPGVTLIVVASSISRGARDDLAAAGVSWISLDGSAHVRAGSLFIDVDVAPPTQRVGPTTWRPAAVDVAEAVLTLMADGASDAVPGVAAISRRSGRSLGTVSAALEFFDANLWTARADNRSRTLVDGAALVDSWAGAHAATASALSLHALASDSATLERAIVDLCGPGAIFGGSAVARAAGVDVPGSFEVTAYVERLPDETLLASGGMRRVERPSRIALQVLTPVVQRAADGDHVPPLTHPVRAYRDLLATGVRGDQVAQDLRRRKLPW